MKKTELRLAGRCASLWKPAVQTAHLVFSRYKTQRKKKCTGFCQTLNRMRETIK